MCALLCHFYYLRCCMCVKWRHVVNIRGSHVSRRWPPSTSELARAAVFVRVATWVAVLCSALSWLFESEVALQKPSEAAGILLCGRWCHDGLGCRCVLVSVKRCHGVGKNERDPRLKGSVLTKDDKRWQPGLADC